MKLKYKIKYFLPVSTVLLFIVLLITNPKISSEGAANGLLLCGNVIIPTLFPFTVCVLFLMHSPLFSGLNFLKKFTLFFFGLNPEQFSVMLLSFIGGYPVGARLINELTKNEKISPKNAAVMLNYCVNAGPAFIVIFIGSGLLGNIKAGYILLISHIAASLLLALIFKRFFKPEDIKNSPAKCLTSGDNFVLSVSGAASTIFNICAFVVFFSTVTCVINHFANKYTFLGFLKYILEVTVGVCNTKNIYLISFLLGFAGVSIWCQIIAVTEKFKYNFLIFALCRILHGIISIFLTFILLKLFPVSIQTSASYTFSLSYSTLAVSLSMLITAIIFIISVSTKNKCGNIISDLV